MTTETIHYALVGDGRLARHFRAYLAMLGLPCSAWARNPESPFNTHTDSDASIRLDRTLAPATHVLLLVSDLSPRPMDSLILVWRIHRWFLSHEWQGQCAIVGCCR